MAADGTTYDSDDSSLSSNASGSASYYHREAVFYDRYWRRPAPFPAQVRYTPDDLLNGSQWDRLSQEIWDKFVTSQQTEETFRKKMCLWRRLYMIVKSALPRQSLQVVGSTLSGFALEGSDLDLCLCPGAVTRPAALEQLERLRRALPASWRAVLVLARVPLLRLAAGGVLVDVSSGGGRSALNTRLLRALGARDWRARPAVLCAKLWAAAHGIKDAHRRTLSSYALTLSVLGYLQSVSPPVLPPPDAIAFRSRNRQSLGELFAGWLRYYAEFPYARLVVSVRAGHPLPVAACRAGRDPHDWKLLCIEEPFDLSNTARTVYNVDEFNRIVETFRLSYERLSTSLCLADAWPRDH